MEISVRVNQRSKWCSVLPTEENLGRSIIRPVTSPILLNVQAFYMYYLYFSQPGMVNIDYSPLRSKIGADRSGQSTRMCILRGSRRVT